LQLVTPGGEVIAVDAQSTPDLFSAARVSLGALGVVTEVTLKVESAFQLRERTLLLQLDDVLAQVDKWALDSEHFKFLWYPHTDVCVVYDQSRTVAVSSPPPSSSWLRDRLVGYHLLESLLFLSK
jgi:L-gulonolactone oxidase